MRKSIKILLLVFALLMLVAGLFQSKLYWLHKKTRLTNTEKKNLTQLGLSALQSLDVPVSCLIIYNTEIVGKGYNTVLKDGNAGGHAEINAISDVLKNLGIKKFNALNRDSLILITTYEPCSMCKGAILEYRIKQVEFLKEKDISQNIKNYLKSYLYEFSKYKVQDNGLQDSLFRLHPSYPKE